MAESVTVVPADLVECVLGVQVVLAVPVVREAAAADQVAGAVEAEVIAEVLYSPECPLRPRLLLCTAAAYFI
jgi:hypothetical protein